MGIFKLEFEVRDNEVDMQGIVNNANYFIYLAHARHKYLKEIGVSFAEMSENKQYLLLTSSNIEFKRPLRAEDKFYVTCKMVLNGTLRFVFAGTLANLASNFLNIYIVSKLKIPFEGKLFWLRSILSVIISGLLLVTIIIAMGFSGNEINFQKSWIMFKSTYSLEILYALILAIPASLTVKFLKRAEKVDFYDYHTNFNPFQLS